MVWERPLHNPKPWRRFFAPSEKTGKIRNEWRPEDQMIEGIL
jgi:hypothetical protein